MVGFLDVALLATTPWRRPPATRDAFDKTVAVAEPWGAEGAPALEVAVARGGATPDVERRGAAASVAELVTRRDDPVAELRGVAARGLQLRDVVVADA